MKDMKRKFKRLAKSIKEAWPEPKAKRPKTADGPWTLLKGEDEGVIIAPASDSKAGSKAIKWANLSRP